MNECFRCNRKEDAVRLNDAIYGNEIVKICEECAFSEDIPIIRRPTSFQLEASVKPYSVRERLSRMAGLKGKTGGQEIQKRREEIKPSITLDNLRKPKDYSRIMEERWQAAKIRNQPLNLIDNWNWHLQNARRDRKQTLGQVAGVIGENETTLKLIEQGNLMDDANKIISKLEQYFRLNLRKTGNQQESERIEKAKENVMQPQQATEEKKMPARILNFNQESLKNITISDLKRMKDDRERYERELASSVAWKGIDKAKEDKKEKKESGVVGSDVEISDD
jgi:ribosome-binding protein aMBF1 (putative translation factor)